MRGYSIIKKRSDFLAANRGKRYATPGFVLLVKDRQDESADIRLGITITKKVGNAVVRNRLKRQLTTMDSRAPSSAAPPSTASSAAKRVSREAGFVTRVTNNVANGRA